MIMKKVVFIGKFNLLFEEMNNYLANHFNVQVCADNVEMLKSILNLGAPDIFLFDMLGLGDERAEILDELKNFYSHVPLICMKAIIDDMSEDALEGIKRARILEMPLEDEEIVINICEMLGLKYDHDKKVVDEDVKKKKCVLAIDDNAIQLRVLNELLKNKYDVMLATSAMKALTMIGKRVPDVILLDYEMPMCDGKMTMEMIREIDEAKDVPIIFLTGVRDTEHIKAVVDLHPAGYLLKPAKNDMIMEEIAKHVGE